MKVLVCGGREYSDYTHMCKVLDKLHAEHCFTVLIHGDSGQYKLGQYGRPLAIKGADVLAGRWADERGVQQVRIPANWTGQDNAAGMLRNQFMLDFTSPDMCIGFPGGVGTNAMMYRSFKEKITVIDTDDVTLP